MASFDLTLLEDLPTVVLGGLRPEPRRKTHLVKVDKNLHFNSGCNQRKQSFSWEVSPKFLCVVVKFFMRARRGAVSVLQTFNVLLKILVPLCKAKLTAVFA